MKAFTVVAKTRQQMKVSRHGINLDKGGVVVHTESFCFPETPYYMACEMVREDYPNCDVFIKTKGHE